MVLVLILLVLALVLLALLLVVLAEHHGRTQVSLLSIKHSTDPGNLHLMRNHVHPNRTESRTARSPKESTTHLVASESTSGTAKQSRSKTLLTLGTARASRVALLRGRRGAVV